MEPSPTVSQAAQRAHTAALSAGEPGYLDPDTGFFVFTEAALRAQGSCCGSGCRHCPYGTGSTGRDAGDEEHEHARHIDPGCHTDSG